MADPGEDERAGEGRQPHRAGHQAERDDAVEHSVGVDGHQDAAHARVERVRDEHHDHDRPHERRVPEEPVPLAQLGEVALDVAPRTGRGALAGTKTNMSSAETANVTASSTSTFVGADDGDQHARERRAEHVRAARDAVEEARAALERHLGPLEQLGQHRLARRLAGRVEERSGEDEREQRGERQADRVVEDRDAEHGDAAREVGDDARAPVAEPVDDDAAERGGDDERKEREEADEAGLGDAAGRLEHEPGDRELREAVARDRDRIRGEEAEEGRSLLIGRAPAARGGRGGAAAAPARRPRGLGARAPQVRREDGVDLLARPRPPRRRSGSASRWRCGLRRASRDRATTRRRRTRASPARRGR